MLVVVVEELINKQPEAKWEGPVELGVAGKVQTVEQIFQLPEPQILAAAEGVMDITTPEEICLLVKQVVLELLS
jgi:hypothetical protein